MYSLESAVDAPLRLFYRATIIAPTPLGASLIAAAGGGPRGTPDRSMLRLLAQAHRYREMMLEAQGRTMPDLAREAGVERPYFCRIVRLGFLAPDVVRAVYRCSGNVLLWMRYT